MSDCLPNSECVPIGTPVSDPCSPCFAPSEQQMLAQIAVLNEKVCALQTENSNWAQLLQRTRNRLTLLEDKFSRFVIPDDDTAVVNPCTNAPNVDDFAAVMGCEGGSPALISPTAENVLVGCGTSWQKVKYGRTFIPISTGPAQVWVRPGAAGSANTSTSVALTEFPAVADRPCSRKVYAMFRGSIGSNATSFNAALLVNGHTVAQVTGNSQTDFGYHVSEIADTGVITVQTVQYGGSSFSWGAGLILEGYLL
jgi:hypothetical protein